MACSLETPFTDPEFVGSLSASRRSTRLFPVYGGTANCSARARHGPAKPRASQRPLSGATTSWARYSICSSPGSKSDT
jgi:hypothetical protein